MFKEKLLNKEKTQTIRKLCLVGEIDALETKLKEFRIRERSRLDIWWRNPRNQQPDCYKIGTGRATSVTPILIEPDGIRVVMFTSTRPNFFDPRRSARIAIRDGFESYSELFSWFRDRYVDPGIGNLIFAMIRWQWIYGPFALGTKTIQQQLFPEVKKK